MPRLIIQIILLLGIVLFFSCEKNELPTNQNLYRELFIDGTFDEVYTNHIFNLINNYRIEQNKEILLVIKNAIGTKLSLDHCNYMIDNKRISHDGYNDRVISIQDNGGSHLGENVARGYKSPESLLKAWINSPSHKNVIEGNYKYMSAVAKEKDSIFYVTLLLYR